MDEFNNHGYYLARASAARDLAQRAANPAIAAIHQEMASRYDHTAAQIGQRLAKPNDAQAA